MDNSKVKEEIWQTIQDMNRLWTVEGKAAQLTDYFHERMVAIAPTTKERLEGRDACVAGWKGFTDAATIHSWEEKDPKIELFGDDKFAVVTYYYDMSFDMVGHTVNMGGRDMFSLINEDDKWLVVSDQFSAYP